MESFQNSDSYFVTRGLNSHQILSYKNVDRKQPSVSAVSKASKSANFEICSEQLSQERETLKLMTSCYFLPFLDRLALSKVLPGKRVYLQSLSRKKGSLMTVYQQTPFWKFYLVSVCMCKGKLGSFIGKFIMWLQLIIFIQQQPTEKTMVKQVVILQPMEVRDGADIHPDSFRHLFSWNTVKNHKLSFFIIIFFN